VQVESYRIPSWYTALVGRQSTCLSHYLAN